MYVPGDLSNAAESKPSSRSEMNIYIYICIYIYASTNTRYGLNLKCAKINPIAEITVMFLSANYQLHTVLRTGGVGTLED